MLSNVLRATKYIYHVDVIVDVGEPSKNLFTKNCSYLGIVDRDRNYLAACSLHVLRHIKRGLIGLRFSLDTKHSDRSCLSEQAPDMFRRTQKIVAPISSHEWEINADYR